MQASAYQAIRVERREHVVTIVLNRPERKNALSPDMVNELVWALDDVREDRDVRVVVLTGAGGTFCAGGDLRQMSGQGAPQEAAAALPHRGGYPDVLLRLLRLDRPTVARVQGQALGGGLGLVASCHFAIGAQSATLGTPEVRLGLFPMMIVPVLAALVPRRELLRLVLLGERVGAEEARRLGLLTDVVPDGELDAAVDALVARLLAQSPSALRHGLDAMAWQQGRPMDEALPELERRLFALLGTEDAREGLTAFLERRTPVWRGH